MRLTRTAAFAGGACAALLIGSGTAVATGAGSVLLGEGNATKATTGLSNSKGTPLSLAAKKGTPPLKVSNTVKVKNLDSDLLDGKDSTYFLAKAGRAADAAKLGGVSASGYLAAGGTAADASKLGGVPAANYVGTTYYAATSVDANPPVRPKLDDSLIDAVQLPAGTYLVTFAGDFANTATVNGDFGCELIFGTTATPDSYGFFANVSMNPGGNAGSTTYASGTVSQMVTLAAAKQVAAECYVNAGDTGHTSYLYNSSLTAVRVQNLQGTASPLASTPLGRHARQR